MQRPIAYLVTLLMALLGLGVISTASPAAADRDCSDFATQAAAQHFFIANGGPSRDPHYLDADGDGEACESNPCPCYYGTSGPKPPSQQAPSKPKKKKHSITGKIVRSGPAKTMRLTGKVSTFKAGQIQVRRKVAGKSYRTYKSIATSGSSGAFERTLDYIGRQRTCFEVVVPATAGYLKTTVSLGCYQKP